MNKRKKTNRSLVHNILLAVFAYAGVWLFLNMLGTVILFSSKQASFIDCFRKIAFGSADFKQDSSYELIILSITRFTDMIATVILTSYIFIFVLNKKPSIIMANKMVIRRRANGELSLSIIVGNKSSFLLENVECNVRCIYIKTDTDGGINGEFNESSKIPDISNFYRFSYTITELPQQFLKNHIMKDNRSFLNDTITVMISGQSRFIGSKFCVSKVYRHEDIVIHDKEVIYKDSETQKVFWDRILNNPNDCSEITRVAIVEELSRICEYVQL